MKFFLAALCLALLFAVTPARAAPWQPAEGYAQIALWPQGAPASDVKTEGPENFNDEMLWNVDAPTMTVYPPKAGNTGVAIMVFPGGGYTRLAMVLEGTEICDWITAKGMTCVLLKYRVPNSGPHWDKTCNCHRQVKVPAALQDAQRAMGILRRDAGKWNIDPHKIGVLGFSAGGHMIADLSTHFEKRAYKAVDDADVQSARPDFAVGLYPGHMRENTTQEFQLNPKVPVTGKEPPTFLLQAENDPVDDVENSLVYFEALRKAKVPAELHIYAEGGHAFGLRHPDTPIGQWPQLVEKWLTTIGMLSG